MRKFGLFLLVSAAVAAPSAAWSQEAPAASADEFVCAFSGECAEDADEDTAGAPETGGPGPRISATRGFAISTTTPRTTTPPPAATRRGQAAASPP